MAAPTTIQRWHCESCGYIYDVADGDPDGGIPPGHGVRGHPRHLVLPGVRRAQARLRPLRRLMAGSPTKSVPPVTRLLARLTGARLCFGRPVTANGRTVIPVASVRTRRRRRLRPRRRRRGRLGGGGGGALDARPVGFIEISSEGTRFERIDDGRMALRALAAGSLAVLVAGRVADAPAPARAERRCAAARRRAARRRALPPPPPPAAARAAALRLRGAHVEPALVGQRVAGRGERRRRELAHRRERRDLDRRRAARSSRGSSARSRPGAPATASARRRARRGPPARAASSVSSVWLIVPSPGRAATTTPRPSSRASARTSQPSRERHEQAADALDDRPARRPRARPRRAPRRRSARPASSAARCGEIARAVARPARPSPARSPLSARQQLVVGGLARLGLVEPRQHRLARAHRRRRGRAGSRPAPR